MVKALAHSRSESDALTLKDQLIQSPCKDEKEIPRALSDFLGSKIQLVENKK
jgi:hypothetical protein